MTYKYFFKCLTLIAGVSHTLPGVFESNPYKNAVNGSLWTLPYELRMYAILAFLWIMLRVTPIHRLKVFKVTIVTCTLSAGFLIILIHIGYINSGILFLKLFFMFFCGASFYILKDRIVISQKILFIFVVALLIAIFDKKMFFFVYIISLAYIVFYIAYIPTGAIRHYNKLGDYSYGMYIYAFPVQQSIAALFPGVSVLSLIVISSVFTLLLAALSWNLIEKHALKFKGKYVTRTKSLYRKAKNRMSTKV